MANNNESTMKWKVDVTQLQAAMQDAKRAISSANAEFKTATAGMDKWQNSTTGLEAKLKQLNSTLPQQKSILSQLEKQYELTAKELGEGSKEAEKLKIQIENQKAAIAKTEASIDKYNGKLDEMNSATGKLNAKINEQESELDSLKKKYADAVVEFGEGSEQAEKLAKDISDLSGELADNKKKLKDAESAADKFDQSLGDVDSTSKITDSDINDLNGGFTVLKGTLANLAAEGIKAAISGLKKLGKAAVDAVLDVAEAGDEIDKESQKLGISAELYQKLSYALDRSGGSIDDFSKGIKNITLALDKTQKGVDGASKKFDDLGVSVKNTDGSMRSSEEVLMDTIEALADMKDETARNAAANDIFGKSYQDLAPFLNEGAQGIKDLMKEAEEYGMVMSNEAVKASADFEDKLTKLKGTVNGVKTRLVQKLLPALSDIAEGFADMANGSDTAGEKIKKGVNKLKTEVVKILQKLMPEFTKNVLPVLGKVYSTVKTLITFIVKNFGTIAPIVLTAVAAFTAFKAVMSITTAISAAKTAITGLNAGVSLATKAQLGWNAAMAANPIGALITAVAALAAGIIYLVSTQEHLVKEDSELETSLREENDQIRDNIQAWNDLKDAQQKQIDAGMSEMSYYESLKKELGTLVDENGKVKEGYETRVSFITSQLSQALGIEIEMVDGVIQEYGTLMDTIDQVMEKKKADIILSSQEELYKEAIQNQAQALKDYAKYQQEYSELNRQMKNSQHELAELQALDTTNMTAAEKKSVGERIRALKEWIAENDDALIVAHQNYEQQTQLVSEYAYNIGQYEKNMQLAHEGNYAAMTNTSWEYVQSYQNVSDAQKKIAEDQLEAEKANLELLKQLKEENGTDIYDMQIQQSEDRIEALQKDIKKYTAITQSGLQDAAVIWQDGLDDQLSALTGKEIEFKEAGDGLVQMFADGVKVGEPVATDEMAQVVSNAIKEISVQYTNAEDAGENLINGVNNGIANERKQSTVFNTIANFGNKLLLRLQSSLKEKSPSKASDQMGQYLMVGLDQGIEKKKKMVLDDVAAVGEEVLDTMNSEMSEGVNAPTISMTGVKASLKNSMAALKASVASQSDSINGAFGGSSSSSVNKSQVVNFTQNINSPKAVDGLTLYRQTNSLLFAAKVGLNNV